MGQVRVILLALVFFSFTVASCQRIEPGRDKILFLDNDKDVLNALHRMEYFMNKFPKTYTVSCYSDDDGYLHLSGQKIAPLKGAINNPKVRKDMVFETFSQKEIDEFFNVMALLMRNDIDGWYKESSTGKFFYTYKSTEVSNGKDIRDLLIVTHQSDTSSANCKKYFRIIDKRVDVILIKLKDKGEW